MTSEDPQPEMQAETTWRGIDLSGHALVIGPGEGRLLEALAAQAAAQGGRVITVSRRLAELQPHSAAALQSVDYVQSSARALPFADGTIDLVVMSGSLRQVPLRALRVLFDEVWRVMVPGGQLRLSDVLEASEAPYNEAWRQRSAIISRLAQALDRPTALHVDLPRVAETLGAIGFENLAVSLLPGYPLTDAWLENTEEAVLAMLSGAITPDLRRDILENDLPRLLRAFRSGDQRAAERFVLRGSKVGALALDMEASFTEDDLVDDDDL